jgi:phosphatidylinositol alpha-1,6-mannosyltransferase
MLAIGVHRALADGTPPFWVWTYGIEVWDAWKQPFEEAMAAAVKIVAISEFTASRVWSRLPEATVPVVFPALPEGIAEVRPHNGHGRRTPVLLTVSRLSEEKGHDKVMAAIPLIEAALGRRVEYRVVGSGDQWNHLHGLAERLEVADRVHFLGSLAEAEKVRELHQCDLFVMPTRYVVAPTGFVGGEGFGISYIEASAACRPVVASAHGGAPETVLDGVTGLVVDPTSEAAIADACVRIISSPELARHMGSEGQRFVAANFGQDAFDRRLALALEEVAPSCAE